MTRINYVVDLAAKLGRKAESWNLTAGCTPVSPGCDNCWARSMAERFGHSWKGEVQLAWRRIDDPWTWRKPRVVAVNFTGDLLHDDVPDDFIASAFCNMIPRHLYLVLTKRPERLYRLTEYGRITIGPHIWLGVTAENQETFDRRWPLLRDTPAAKRWVSAEPMLGDVNPRLARERGPLPNWVVIGCESGPQRRPCELADVRFLLREYQAAGCPVYIKQLDLGGACVHDIEDFPSDLRVRQLPGDCQPGQDAGVAVPGATRKDTGR